MDVGINKGSWQGNSEGVGINKGSWQGWNTASSGGGACRAPMFMQLYEDIMATIILVIVTCINFFKQT